MNEIKELEQIIDKYDIVFCDVWGVLHNGVRVYTPAVAALEKIRQQGKCVILITNSPRLCDSVQQQLLEFSIDEKAYDALITSGDATHHLIEAAPEPLYVIGPEHYQTISDKKTITTNPDDAKMIVCIGLKNDEKEMPEDYASLLSGFLARGVPFICVNPDIAVERGDKYIWCAGALARLYTQMGGTVLMAGKPYETIYDLATKTALQLCPNFEGDKSKILAIGDGLLTDIKGAENFAIDALFIAQGLHSNEYMRNGDIDKKLLEETFSCYKTHPKFYTQVLR